MICHTLLKIQRSPMQELIEDLKEEMAELDKIREDGYTLEYLSKEKKAKKRWIEPDPFFENILDIIYHYDPAGFAKKHAPKERYNTVVSVIIYRLGKVTDLSEMQWMIYDIFFEWLSESRILPGSDRCYRYMAEEIWEAWEEEIGRLGLRKSTAIFGK